MDFRFGVLFSVAITVVRFRYVTPCNMLLNADIAKESASPQPWWWRQHIATNYRVSARPHCVAFRKTIHPDTKTSMDLRHPALGMCSTEHHCSDSTLPKQIAKGHSKCALAYQEHRPPQRSQHGNGHGRHTTICPETRSEASPTR